MNISCISFRSSFLSVHNMHNKNSSKLSNIQNNALNKNQSISDKLMIDKMKFQLSGAQKSESESQQGMFFLKEEKKAIDSLKDLSKELKNLSSKYKDESTSCCEKQDIEKKANDIIKNMDNIINNMFGDKSIFSGEQINIETGYRTNITIKLKNFDISLDQDKKNIKDLALGFHVEGKLNINEILSNTNNIEENLIKPLDKFSDDIKGQMVGVVNNVIYQDMLINMSVKKLSEYHVMDGYEAQKIIENSSDIVDNAFYDLYGVHYNGSEPPKQNQIGIFNFEEQVGGNISAIV